MKRCVLAISLVFVFVSTPANSTEGLVTAESILPSGMTAKAVLNSTRRHREWVNIPVGASNVRVFIVYPDRSDPGPVVLLTAHGQGATDAVRALGDQVAAAGFVAAIPDVRSTGNNAVLAYATSLPAANGKTARLELYAGSANHARIEAEVDAASARKQTAGFALTNQEWRRALDFVSRQTNDKPVIGPNPNVGEDHTAHVGHLMMLAQNTAGAAPAPGRGPGRGYPTGKLPNLPAGVFTAKSTLANSKLRREFVDIPLGDLKLHTWVEYPGGEGKAPLAIVMQHGPGMDDWQRALADQLAFHGFIAIATDLHSGLGPNGGNYDSFTGTDDVMLATSRLTPEEMMRRYKAARDWGLKLSRSNGKTASVGFCMGGGNSFRFAAEIPELNAAVVFYGTPPDRTLLTRIKAPVLAFYGDDDARVTATMEPTQVAMKELGRSFEAHTYPHGTHGFLEFQDLAGNPAATADSWSRTIAFLNEHTK